MGWVIVRGLEHAFAMVGAATVGAWLVVSAVSRAYDRFHIE